MSYKDELRRVLPSSSEDSDGKPTLILLGRCFRLHAKVPHALSPREVAAANVFEPEILPDTDEVCAAAVRVG